MSTEPASVPLGTVIGRRYRLERLIGKGGFGAVFAAADLHGRDRVAIKILSTEMLAEIGGEARVHREADLARRLAHPNTVRVLDLGKDPSGVLYIVFELLEGRSIESALREDGPFSPQRACAIAMEVLSALDEAHRNGVIHRDIKPANIFLVNPGQGGTGGTVNTNAADRVKVLDFGIAKSTNSRTHAGLTREGTSVGTPAYMAPEQMLGQPIGPPTDLYAVGLVLAEMVIGESPYGPSPSAMGIVVDRVAGKPVPLPRALVDSPLGPFVKRATADIVYRFVSASEMRNALASIAGSLSNQASARIKVRGSPGEAGSAVAVGTDRTQPSADVRQVPAARISSPLASSFAIDGPLDKLTHEPKSPPGQLAATTSDQGVLPGSTGAAPSGSRTVRNKLAATAPDYGPPDGLSRGAISLSSKKRLEQTVKQDDGVASASSRAAPATQPQPKPAGSGWTILVVVGACVLILGCLAAAYFVLHHPGWSQISPR